MLNQFVAMGRLTADPELRRTQNNTAVTSFTLAVERDIPNKQTGERETDFIDFVAWGKTAEFVSKYFSKGRMMAVKGRLQTRIWTDKENKNHKAVEVNAEGIYFADSKKEETGGDTNGGGYGSQFSGFAGVEVGESDLPF